MRVVSFEMNRMPARGDDNLIVIAKQLEITIMHAENLHGLAIVLEFDLLFHGHKLSLSSEFLRFKLAG